MRPAVRRSPTFRSIALDAVALQHRPKGQTGEAHAEVGQERTAAEFGSLPHDLRAFVILLPLTSIPPTSTRYPGMSSTTGTSCGSFSGSEGGCVWVFPACG